MGFDIDYTNRKQLIELMDKADEFDTMVVGKNDVGETVCTSIFKDKVVAEIYQDNGWLCKLTFYRDGSYDETYEKY